MTQGFLGRHAEFLLLVYYQQTQVLEHHVFVQETVRSYYYVYLSFLESRQDIRHFLWSPQPAQIVYIAGKVT